MQKNLSKEQLFAHFEGKSSVLMKHELEAWLQNPVHQEFYYQCLEEWERQNLHWQPQTENAFEELQQRIKDLSIPTEPNEEPVEVVLPLWRQWGWVAAASVAVLLVASYLLRDLAIYKTYNTEYGAMQNIRLEDGTLVNLNANSTLKVPRFGFGTDTREVQLDGEAYFSVRHTPTHQKFIVQTNQDFSVEVLGTEFSVRKRKRGMQVVLDKGKVKVHYGTTQQPITMKPGDLVTLDQKGKVKVEQTLQPQKYSAWRVHKFVFDKTSLQEVGNLLQDSFGLTVEIHTSELAKRSISGEIEAHNADELIEALIEVFALDIKRKNQTIVIKSASI